MSRKVPPKKSVYLIPTMGCLDGSGSQTTSGESSHLPLSFICAKYMNFRWLGAVFLAGGEKFERIPASASIQRV